MKNRRILLVGLMVVFGCGGMQAQSTPDAIIRQCPDLPSVAQLATPDNAAIDDFLGQISNLHQKLSQIADNEEKARKTAMLSDAEQLTLKTTGHSVGQIQNMSGAEMEALTQQLASQRMSSAGLGNMTLEQLQALDGKSDKEIAASLTASGATFGGLTAEEIFAMEGMTEAQAEAYLNQGDRMERMQAATKPQQAKSAGKGSAQTNATAEIKKITDRWTEIRRLNQKETQEVAAKCAEIDARYAPQIAAVPRTGGHHEAVYTESEQKTLETLNSACRNEKYTIWRNLVSKMQGRVKTMLADVPRYDELQAQLTAANGMAATSKKMPSLGFDVAGEYLNITESATVLP